MLGLELTHIGVNCENEEQVKREGALLAKLFALPVRDCGPKCDFIGDMFEMMKAPGRGEKGHIAIGTRDIVRAMFHMELRGFEFDEPMRNEKGKITACYLKNDIAGFAFHLLQK
jgi:2-dehydro-3-deoxyphosphogluconate aldolase/(4S)-4-hydroxy-2-oxoglutarate aldolase